ncbi:MAG: hypothetical protein ACOY3Z_11195 [Thermodesulfobacteriota bacterium]
MQLRYPTDLSAEEFARQPPEEYDTYLSRCPLHPQGGCGYARHGTYPRKSPQFLAVPRWYCRLGRKTFSLLPDCLTARLPGSLDEAEAVVKAVEEGADWQAIANKHHPHAEPPGSIRWVKRRVVYVRQAVVTSVGLLGLAAAPTVTAVKAALGVDRVLVHLRQRLSEHLQHLPAILGFFPRLFRQPENQAVFQHRTALGPSG